jgi:serine/threonine protein phosphatase PrpC
MRPGQDFGGGQDCGRRRSQEDSFAFQPIAGTDGTPDGLLMALADGMGGHKGGAHASAVAIESFVQAYAAAPETEPEAERLQRGLQAANERIARDAGADGALRGMGCTLVGASVTPAGLFWASVGDSPFYLFRDGTLTRLNADHSMAPVIQQAVLLGTLSEEEAASHPNRNALRSAVMGRELSLVDLRAEPLELRPGDRLLLASDGLLTLPEARISELLERHADRSAEELTEILLEAVSSAGNPYQDNVTVLLASVPPDGAAMAKAEAGRPVRILPGRAAAALRRVLQPRFLALLGTGFLLAAVAVGLVSQLPRRWPWQASRASAPAVTTASPGAGSQPQAQPDASTGPGPDLAGEQAKDKAPRSEPQPEERK